MKKLYKYLKNLCTKNQLLVPFFPRLYGVLLFSTSCYLSLISIVFLKGTTNAHYHCSDQLQISSYLHQGFTSRTPCLISPSVSPSPSTYFFLLLQSPLPSHLLLSPSFPFPCSATPVPNWFPLLGASHSLFWQLPASTSGVTTGERASYALGNEQAGAF